VQILLILSSKNVRGPAARSTEYGGRSAESMRFMRSRIALSVWRLDNSAPTPPAYNYPDPRFPFSLPFHLRTFAQELRSDLHLCTAIFPHSVLRTRFSTLYSDFHLSTGLRPICTFALLSLSPRVPSLALRLRERLPQLRHRRATRINRHRTGFSHGAAMRVIGEDLLLNLNQ